MYSSGIAGLNTPIEQNQMYPGSQQVPSQYATPLQMPISSNVINASYEPKSDSYSGQMMAGGGIASIPINIPTQGLPESFQSVGMMNVSGKILPLYGRRTAGSSDRWNYYTRTDTYNPVPIPVKYNRRDCMDDTGCTELYSGEQVKMEGTGDEGKVTLYTIDGPKYIPGLL
jgi:hypothetical protein